MLSKFEIFFKELQFWTLIGFALTVPFSKALANIFIVATAVSWALHCILARRFYFPRTPFNWLLLIFIASLLSSFLETSSVELSIRGVSKVVQRLGFFFLALQVIQTHSNRLEQFIGWLSVGFGVVLSSGITQLITGHDFLRGRILRFIADGVPKITSSFEHTSQYGLYLVFMIFLMGFWLLSGRTTQKRKIYLSTLVLVGVASLVMTHSRASWVSFICALIFSSLYFKRAFLSLMITLSVVATLLLAVPSDLLIHKDAQGKEQSASERFILWNRASKMIQAHPLTGVGINTYSQQSEIYRTDSQDNLSGYYAHNSYLQLGAESGIPSLSLFLIFMVGSLVWGLGALKRRVAEPLDKGVLRACIAGGVAFCAINMLETSLFSVQPSQLYYFFLALMFAIVLKYKNSAQGLPKT